MSEILEKSGSEDEKRKRRQAFKKHKEKLKQKMEMYYEKNLNEHAEKSKPVISQKKKTDVDEKVSKVPLEPNVEFFRMKVNILQDVSEETITSSEIQRDIVNPEEIIVERRKNEGKKPIFDRPEVRLFHQIQREKENEIFKQKQVFVHELKKLVKLLFPEEHSEMSANQIRGRSNSADHRDRYHSPQTSSISKSPVLSEKLEANNEHKSFVESEITTNRETVKSSELQNDVRFDDVPLTKQEVEETKSPLDHEEIKLLDEWQKEIDARRQSCLKQLEKDRSRWRSKSRSPSPYYRSKSLTRDEILYREYEMSRERHERRRASELAYYMDRIPIPAYYDAMPLRMMPIRPPASRGIFPGEPRLPFPGRTVYPGMRPQFFPPGT